MNEKFEQSSENKNKYWFRNLTPFFSFIAMLLSLINLLYISRIESNIQDLQYSVNEISGIYDHSDIVNAIEDAENNIIGSVEDAENNIRHSIVIWSN